MLKKKQFQACLDAMRMSRELQRQEGDSVVEADLARFKTQELHMLNSLLNCFLQVDYVPSQKLNLPKTVAHNNLVELNMNALRGNFEVDED